MKIFSIPLLFFALLINKGSAQEITDDEYNRILVAERSFRQLDINRDGILNEDDLSRVRNTGQKKRLAQLIDQHRSISMEGYIEQFEIAALPWEGDKIENVVYKRLGDVRLMLDIYMPARRNESEIPVVMYIHGGGWTNGDKHRIGNRLRVMEMLSDHQIAFVSVNYRLTNREDVFVKDCVTDAKDALRFLNKEADKYGFDPDKILVWGSSAGAHLAMMLNHTDKDDFKGDEELFKYSLKPAGAISWFGPASLVFPDTLQSNRRFKDLMSRIALDENDIIQEAEKISPVHYVDSDDPPLFLMQGDQDVTVTPEQAYIMERYLKKENAEYRLLIVKNAGHGWSSKTTPEPSAEEILKVTADYAIKLLGTDQ
jgi:acetyl esterase/lipase